MVSRPVSPVRGSLHVIMTAYHDTTRIDQQLFGPAGRRRTQRLVRAAGLEADAGTGGGVTQSCSVADEQFDKAMGFARQE